MLCRMVENLRHGHTLVSPTENAANGKFGCKYRTQGKSFLLTNTLNFSSDAILSW